MVKKTCTIIGTEVINSGLNLLKEFNDQVDKKTKEVIKRLNREDHSYTLRMDTYLSLVVAIIFLSVLIGYIELKNEHIWHNEELRYNIIWGLIGIISLVAAILGVSRWWESRH